MQKSSFVYVTYIRTTPEKLWTALTQSEFTRQYFFGTTWESDWQVGSPWKMTQSDGRITDAGIILECEPHRKLVLKWRSEFTPEMTAEGYTRMTYLIEPGAVSIKLTVMHEIDRAESKVINAVSNGWPAVLASLKSLLETGHALAEASPCHDEKASAPQ